jgi:hypothetical protein
MAGLGSYQAPNRRSDAQSGSWVRLRGASGEVIEIASLIGRRGGEGARSPTEWPRDPNRWVAAWRK